MALKKVALKGNLKSKAEDNTSISIKHGRDEPVIIKEGIPVSSAEKRLKPFDSNARKVGIAKGITKNMDNYESLRVDVWLIDEVAENETFQEACTRIGEIVDIVLEEQTNSIAE